MNLRVPAFLSIIPLSLGILVACSSDDTTTPGSTPTNTVDGGNTAAQTLAGDPTAVLENYATNLYAAYGDSVTDEAAFATAVTAFLAAPSEATMTTIRQAWIDSRAHYMLTEGARFYDGPIDEPTANHEGAINSWPLDEAYIDYTTAESTAGFVNNPASMEQITPAALDEANGLNGDENISAGWHAIEFLLWGQATDAVGPGKRPATDYLTGTGANVDRRSAYLTAATTGISTHLTAVRDAWKPGATYRTAFTTGGYASIAKALSGLGRFSKGELAGERINAAYKSKERRDQHDCFSSLTLTDYDRDARGVLAIYTGHYGSNTTGAGIDTLVAKVDAALDARIKTALQASIDAVNAIPKPFEEAIVGDDTAPGRVAILDAVTKLRAQGDLFAEAATALGLTVEVPDEN